MKHRLREGCRRANGPLALLVVWGYWCVLSVFPNGLVQAEQPTTTSVEVLWSPEKADGYRLERATAEVISRDGVSVLRIRPEAGADSATVRFHAPTKTWNLSSFRYVGIELSNPSAETLRIQWRARSKGKSLSRDYILEPGETVHLRLTLRRAVPEPLRDVFFGMRGFPELLDPEGGIDVSTLEEVVLSIRDFSPSSAVEVQKIFASGSFQTPPWWNGETSKLFPLIDEFGQYRHRDWPGKIHSVEELAEKIREEDRDLAAHPGPGDWDQFGGWKSGPHLEATGHFRVTKHEGKWWLVDPEGRLFWSHGMDCVRSTTATTPITDREHWFQLPPKDGPFGVFYGRASWAPHGYYQGKGTYQTFCFSGANLLRKYGPNWEKTFNERMHQRLRSWGINTIGNWSDPAIYGMRRTPYVVTLSSGARRIEGSTGYWGKFADPFDPNFDRGLLAAMQREADSSAKDPWCLGYFVDNELSWGDELSLAVATVRSPADQPAKKVFQERLWQKYGDIAKLNAVWGTNFSSWDDFLQKTDEVDQKKAREDLAAFYSEIAETYFRRCRDAVKKFAPDKLYLGCRFAWVNDRAIRAASLYCDVVSFNRYEVSVASLRLPEGIDKPVIIGEFHFGALDRGMFHTGLREAADQVDRAECYRRYVKSGLLHPHIVGTHWFQLMDQPTTGRGDGENYQIGFLDVCDTPYPEIIQAARDVASSMYTLRSASGR
ncbi:beta-galactosidase [Thermogutta sp.]|uniref:beta-galactosidase n=1 Tax=Thermogutta sp. TaxID=1962930 RepID=UPI00321FF2E6